MRPRSNWNRRTFLGSVAALAGSLAAPKQLFASARSASRAVSGFGQSGNPYEELGVTTVINCEGTMTMLGGSLPHPELEAVMMQGWPPFRQHSRAGGRRRKQNRRNAQAARGLHRAGHFGGRSRHAIGPSWHSYRL